MGSVNLGT